MWLARAQSAFVPGEVNTPSKDQEVINAYLSSSCCTSDSHKGWPQERWCSVLAPLWFSRSSVVRQLECWQLAASKHTMDTDTGFVAPALCPVHNQYKKLISQNCLVFTIYSQLRLWNVMSWRTLFGWVLWAGVQTNSDNPYGNMSRCCGWRFPVLLIVSGNFSSTVLERFFKDLAHLGDLCSFRGKSHVRQVEEQAGISISLSAACQVTSSNSCP